MQFKKMNFKKTKIFLKVLNFSGNINNLLIILLRPLQFANKDFYP